MLLNYIFDLWVDIEGVRVKLKICFILPTLGNSGGVQIILSIANILAESGNDVDIVYPVIPPNINGWRFKKPFEFVKLIGWIPLNIIRFNRKKYLEKYKYINFKQILTLKNIPQCYEKYVATWWETAVFLKKLKNKEKIYFIQADETWNGNEQSVKETYNYEDFKLITICEYLSNKIYTDFNRKISILYNDIDFKKFNRTETTKENKSIGVIYRKNTWKRFDNFMKYLEKYKKDGVKYYCIGRRVPRKYLEKFNYVYDGNSQSDMNKFYNKIGMLILPSDDKEGFGLPIIEAMMCGTPVAVMNIGIAYEIIDDGINSFIMKNNDEDGINDVINRYLSLSNFEIHKMQSLANDAIKTKYRNMIKDNDKKIIDYFMF